MNPLPGTCRGCSRRVWYSAGAWRDWSNSRGGARAHVCSGTIKGKERPGGAQTPPATATPDGTGGSVRDDTRVVAEAG